MAERIRSGAGGRRRNAPEKGVQVLFMDYLTCLGYNPPKASIRIIASSSSRLRGYRRAFHELPLEERERERARYPTSPPVYLVHHAIATRSVVMLRIHIGFFSIVREAYRVSL